MPDYRIYKLVNGDRIAEMPRIVTHDTDDEAIAQTRQLLDGHDLQLWEGRRLVVSLEAKNEK